MRIAGPRPVDTVGRLDTEWTVSGAYIERMSEVKITALDNGPLEVDGSGAVLASDGTVVKEGSKIFLCRCGHSANKPMCDGSHKREGFIAS